MSDRHCAAVLQQQLGHRFANDVGTADNNSIQPGKRSKLITQKQQTAKRCAGNQRILAGCEPASIHHVKAVNILVRCDRVDHCRLVNLLGQRKLHKNPVNRIILIEGVNQRQQLCLAGCGVKAMFNRAHAGGGCAFNFVAHINGACRVLTNKNHGQCRRAANLRRQRLGFNGDTCHQIFRESLAVDHFCFCHKTPPRASIWNVFGCSWRGHRQPAIHFASPPIRLRRNSAPSSRMTGLISMPPRSGIKRRTRPSSVS